MKKNIQIGIQILVDYTTACIAWTLFYSFRKLYLEPLKYGYDIPLEYGNRFWMGLFFIPFFWIGLYQLIGNYNDIYRRSRLKELGKTILTTLIGAVIIFFTILLDDLIVSYKTYYLSFLSLFLIHFIVSYIPRLIISTSIVKKVHNRIIGFNTLLIGNGSKALATYQEIEAQVKSSGNKFVGYINLKGETKKAGNNLDNYLTCLGEFKDISTIIDKLKIEEVIISIEKEEQSELGKIINYLDSKNVIIKISPELSDILTGSVKMSSIFDIPLIEIKQEIMPLWQKNIKRLIDISVSLFVLIFLSPLLLIISIIIRFTSKGPIIYSQERVGKYGKPFKIYKFRSMHLNAENHGPALSSKNDSRITSIGKVLRKYRFDELPNFLNVLKGEMSLVGPRPERQFFIDQIIQKAPHYSHLQKVKVGITSWGQVKFGYAENVDEMIQRLRYDLLYIDNMSLFVDFKIMIYTVLIVLKGRGK